jgi:hypothetical protein
MRGIEQQFLALQKGFTELIPSQLLRPFDERELELVIGGLGSIDINDWCSNTRLKVWHSTVSVTVSQFCSYERQMQKYKPEKKGCVNLLWVEIVQDA